MKNVTSGELEKVIIKNRKLLILFIIFLVATAVLIFFGYRENKKEKPSALSLNDLIIDKSAKEDVYSYIDVTSKPFLFAVYETDGVEDDNKFYLVMDQNDYLYIIYASTKNFKKLNVTASSSNAVRVYGMTESIGNDIKRLAIDSYNEAHEEEFLNDENFSSYVGLIFLNIERDQNAFSVYYIIAIFTGFFTFIFLISYLFVITRTKKTLNRYSSEELQKINSEIYEVKNSQTEKNSLYLTKNYIVDMGNGLVILKYNDVIWAYPFEQRQNGIIISRNITVMTEDYKIFQIANTSGYNKKIANYIEEVLIQIKEKNNKVLIGYTKENQNKIKELKKNK